MNRFFALVIVSLFCSGAFADLWVDDTVCDNQVVPKQCSFGLWGYDTLGFPTFYCNNGVNTTQVQEVIESYGLLHADGTITLDIENKGVANDPSFKYAKDIINVMDHCYPWSIYDSTKHQLVFSNAVQRVQTILCQYTEAGEFSHNFDLGCVAFVKKGNLIGEIDMKGNYIAPLQEPSTSTRTNDDPY